MTKSELIAKLAARYPQLVAKDAELAVKMILDAMGKSLSQGQRIEIRGFGSFGLNYRPPRTGRNPKSGERVQVPAKYVPHFKAGKGPGCRLDIPLYSGGAYPRLRRAIAKRIHDRHLAKDSSREIALAVGVSQRTVHRHRRAHRGENDDGQGTLL